MLNRFIKSQPNQTQTLIRKRPKQKYKKEYDDYEEPLWEDSSYPEEDYDYVGDDTKVEVGRFMIRDYFCKGNSKSEQNQGC